jgi:hypothetical protein
MTPWTSIFNCQCHLHMQHENSGATTRALLIFYFILFIKLPYYL